MSDEKGYTHKEKENCRDKCGNDYNKGREKNKKGRFNNFFDNNNKKQCDVFIGVPDSAPCPKHGKNHTSARNNNRDGKKGGLNVKKSYNGLHKNNNNQVSEEQYLGQLVAKIMLEEQQKNGQSQGGLTHNTPAQGASTQNGITWGGGSHFFPADDGWYGNQLGNKDNQDLSSN
eukprot:15306098-Ditylum_brightwellii.AAC.1